jgi:hypothetical protein
MFCDFFPCLIRFRDLFWPFFISLSLFAEDVWTADGPLAGEQADGWRLQAGPHHPQQEAKVGRGGPQPAGTGKLVFFL